MNRSPIFLVNFLAGIFILTVLLNVYDTVAESYKPALQETSILPLEEICIIEMETKPVKEVDPGDLEYEEAAPINNSLFGDWDMEAAGLDNVGWTQKGIASWYGSNFHEGPTASGETYDMYSMTAAHRNLPFNTFVEVTLLDSNRSVVVRINNRGPYTGKERIIDLSKKAADKLGIKGQGLAKVKIEVIEAPN